MVRKTSREGFTLIELSLAMVFISLLALAVVLIIINTVNSYRRGITLSEVNSVGSQLVDDVKTAIQNSSVSSIETLCSMNYSNNSEAEKNCKKTGMYYLRIGTGSVVLPGTTNEISNLPLNGAFCTGTYSYLWNSGYHFMNGATVKGSKISLKYTDKNNTVRTLSDFRFLKIRDDIRAVCVKGPTSGHVYDISDVTAKEDVVDLLTPGSTSAVDLALFDLEVAIPSEGASKNNMFYSGWMILGTATGGADITSSSKCIKPNDVGESNFNYCAINRFKFAAQASGSGANQ